MTNDREIEDLRQSTTPSTYVEEQLDEEPEELQSDLLEALQEMDEGELPKVIAVRDRHTTALLRALEETEEGLALLGHTLESSLGRQQSSEFDRSQVLRLAIRLGLQEGAPSYFAQLEDAAAQHARQNL